ncbi:MAG: trehalose-phosphatase, partial [Candidatus Omnitrophota bacterium]
MKRKIKNAKKIIFFLDYDGTLTPIKKRPPLAKIDKEAKAVLRRLAGKKGIRIFIVSGRILENVKNLIGLKSLYYIGNHGIELEGPAVKYVNPKARASRPIIQRVYGALKKKLKIKGVILENKVYTLSVH